VQQHPLTWHVPLPALEDPRDLVQYLRDYDLPVREGRNTIYLPPGERLAGLVEAQQGTYPASAGFKILKRFGSPAETNYLVRQSRLRARARLIGTPMDQLVTANYLHALGLGPRVWDVACWMTGDAAYTVFVVDHVDGRAPTPDEYAGFLADLRGVIARTQLRIVLPGWKTSSDFLLPDCNRNLVITEDARRSQYIDFQNFCLTDRSAWTREVLAAATSDFHFGRGRLLRGSRYLYQSVPGTRTTGKRDVSARSRWLAAALGDAGLGLHQRVVLDVGCNSGMMLQAALAAGARWGLGWDRPAVVRHAEPLLLSLGASRFHLYGAELHPSYRLEDDIPSRLRPALEEAIVLYLSVRQHVGLLDSLRRIPWRALVYEGHQGESLDALPGLLGPLLRDGVGCVSTSLAADGDSAPRPLALLVRQ
jgi:hypothetical protein